MKYKASIHVKTPFDYKFLGYIQADTLKDLRVEAKRKARQNNHLQGRLYLDVNDSQRQIILNPQI